MIGKIGFIGLGIMGRPMAKNLAAAGCELLVNDIVRENADEVCSLGAKWSDIETIAAECDLILTILPNGIIVKEVLFGENGIAVSARPGIIVADMSSVTPDDSCECARRLSEKGIAFLDAPVSGGEPKAIDGTLAFMVGGKQENFDLVKPYFAIMGSSAILVGDTGSGSATKLANQIIVNLTIAAVSEAFVLTSKSGADPEKVYQAIRGGLAGSTVLDAKAGKIFNRDFAPGGKISINLKDMTNVMSTAHNMCVPLPLSGMLLEIMHSLKADGHMNDDHSAIVKFYEKLSNVIVEKKPDTDTLDISVINSFKRADIELVEDMLQDCLKSLNKKIVVLDDDPTGVQTVHGVSVYTDWSYESLREGFRENSSMFFVLTNSRSMSREQTISIHAEIAESILRASAETGKDFIIISRSDSTLRGHYPEETSALRETLEKHTGQKYDGEIIFPFFAEGGRYTINDVHYVRYGNELVPCGKTEFAKDMTFGYSSSNLKSWCEEKSGGTYKSSFITSISIEELRNMELDNIQDKLEGLKDFDKLIVNAVDYLDVKIFCIALARAISKGKRYMFRSAAAVPKVLGGVPDRPLLSSGELLDSGSANGGIVIVGSHVNKTKTQLERLMSSGFDVEFIEFNQHLVLEPLKLENEVQRVVVAAEACMRSGKTAVVYTRRDRLDLGTGNREDELVISTRISDAVTGIVERIGVQPGFIIAKGGITSSDIGKKALKVKKATVMGQILPGIPVWRLGSESRFPGMPYVIFPGNVGSEDALKEIIGILDPNH